MKTRIVGIGAVLALLVTMAYAAVTISVTPSNPSVNIGGTVRLNASPVFLKMRWQSRDDSVATVDASGLVTGVAAGTATMTVSYKNNRGSTVVTVVDPNPLTIVCPVTREVDSADGNAVTVAFTGAGNVATGSGGSGAITITYSPASGSSFSVGATPVQAKATDAAGATATCTFYVQVTDTSEAGIPSTWVQLTTSDNLQTEVTNAAAGTTFYLLAGTYTRSSSVTPKTGDTFICAPGAILDGTGWVSSDATQAAFRAHNQDIDNVTIDGCEIRNFPQKGVHAYKDYADGWVVKNSNIHHNRVGLQLGNGAKVLNNLIHHNTGNEASTDPNLRGGGFTFYKANNTLFEGNEIYANGIEQKVFLSANTTFRGNYLHDQGSGLWCDACDGGLIEGNRIENTTGPGIFPEISRNFIIRNNNLYNTANGIFLSIARGMEVYGNTMRASLRGINMFIDCSRLTAPNGLAWTVDLADNYIHDNIVEVPSTIAGAQGATLYLPGTCTTTQVATYTALANTKNNVIQANHYTVPNVLGRYWQWQTAKTWSEWLALGKDATGTVQ